MLMSMSVPLAALAFFPCFFLFIVVQMDDTELQQFYDEFFEEVYVELEKVGPIAPTPIYLYAYGCVQSPKVNIYIYDSIQNIPKLYLHVCYITQVTATYHR